MSIKPERLTDSVVLFQADCRDVLPTLDVYGSLVLATDPPNGVNLGVGNDRRGKQHGLAKSGYATFEDTYENFVENIIPRVKLAIAACDRGGIFSGPHIQDYPKASYVGGVYCTTATGRCQWGFISFLPVLYYGKDPLLHKTTRPNVLKSNVPPTASKRMFNHPCPKPVEWMNWLVDRVSLPGETVLDPFAGTGTTGVAAAAAGRKAILIESDPAYCEIIRRRFDSNSPAILTPKQAAVMAALAENPTWSNRRIAASVGGNRDMVRKLRTDNSATRVGANGVVQSAKHVKSGIYVGEWAKRNAKAADGHHPSGSK